MNIYRLDPIEFGDASWRYSKEKDSVWACAPTPEEARNLVASKSGLGAFDGTGPRSPWQDDTVTSCILQPSMTLMSAGEVVREDGSAVDYTDDEAA